MSKNLYKLERVIEVSDWDNLIETTYNRPYNFQQQDGCQDRGNHYLTVPSDEAEEIDKEMHDSIPEVVNGDEMGVKLSVWLARDPKQPLADGRVDYGLNLFWERNFYPAIEVVANDLHKKGLLEEGDYTINIDW